MHSNAWKRVLAHELSRRKQFMAEHPKQYIQMFGINLKPLAENCGQAHVWVPATTLMIHDGGRGSHEIYGHPRRGLSEAAPYKKNGYNYIPQLCWNCSETRVLITENLSYKERQVIRHESRAKHYKPKGRKGSAGTVLTNFEELGI